MKLSFKHLTKKTLTAFLVSDPIEFEEHHMTVGTKYNEEIPECVEQHDLRWDADHLGEGVVKFAFSGVEAHLVRRYD